MLAASVGTALLDFVFKAQAAQTMGKALRCCDFFWTLLHRDSLLVFLVQTFITRIVLQRAGLAATAGALPLHDRGGQSGSHRHPGFKVLSGVRGMEILIAGRSFAPRMSCSTQRSRRRTSAP